MRTHVLNSFLVIGFSFALVACGGDGDKSVDAYGNCSESFVSAYNSVTSKINATYSNGLYLGNPANLESIDSACNEFFREHNSVGCKARVDTSNSVENISSDDLKPMCTDAKQRLNFIRDQI